MSRFRQDLDIGYLTHLHDRCTLKSLVLHSVSGKRTLNHVHLDFDFHRRMVYLVAGIYLYNKKYIWIPKHEKIFLIAILMPCLTMYNSIWTYSCRGPPPGGI